MLYIPSSFANLLSLARLRKVNCYLGQDNTLRNSHDEEIGKTTFLEANNLWVLDVDRENTNFTSPSPWADEYNALDEYIFAASHDLWHQRLAHKGMTTLKANSEAVRGMEFKDKPEDHQICQPCELSKSYRHISRVPRSVPDKAGTHLEANIFTVTPKADTKEGKKVYYFLIFRCRKSKAIWAYNLVHKSDAFEAIKKMVAFIKTQMNVSVQTIHFDGDSSFGGDSLVA